MKRNDPINVSIVPVTPENRDALVDHALQTWADDAIACPTCGESWTVERIRKVGAKVKRVDPRVLICAPCWTAQDAADVERMKQAALARVREVTGDPYACFLGESSRRAKPSSESPGRAEDA